LILFPNILVHLTIVPIELPMGVNSAQKRIGVMLQKGFQMSLLKLMRLAKRAF
jgi:hypothetical protein